MLLIIYQSLWFIANFCQVYIKSTPEIIQMRISFDGFEDVFKLFFPPPYDETMFFKAHIDSKLYQKGKILHKKTSA